MPHLRKRYAEKELLRLIRFSPLVGLLGHRQVGKTTLVTALGKGYFSLDLRTTYDLIEADPLGFLSSVKQFPTVLDECQTLPDLFPALKEYVRQHKRPGSFLLTGSVRFTSRKAIRESLTGRIIYSELLPMDLAEIHALPLPESLILIAKGIGNLKRIQSASVAKIGSTAEYLMKGGLPGVFSVRDGSLRIQKIATQLETILDRDLRLILPTSLPYSTLRNVLGYLARHQGESLSLSAMQRATRVTRPTLNKLLLAFEGLFLIRSLAVEGGTGGWVYYLEDQAEASYLIGTRTEPLFDLLRFLYANLRLQLMYRPGLNGSLFRYETRGGALVPLCFRFDRQEIGVIPIVEANPNRSAIASATSFLKKYQNAKVIFVNEYAEARVISPKLCVVPARTLVIS